ncbi:MAG: PD40 domain-containing protein [Flavobacteriales bacterium]|nr:PD40 domain-containing protein [Flavobacteriales bacterium]
MKKNSIKMIKEILFFLFFGIIVSASAQYVEDYPINSGNGDQMISFKNWPEGINQFTELLKKYPDNLEYKYKLGKCYLYADVDKAKSLAYFKDLMAFEKKEKDFYESLAMAYFVNYEFDNAKKIYQQMVDSVSDTKRKSLFIKQIAQCDISKKMMKNPVQVSFENLGKNVNSKAPDFLPIVSPDEAFLAFSTRRKGVVGNLNSYAGYRTSDIFVTKHKRSKYSRARSIGNPNTYGNEFTAGRSGNGKYLTFTVNSDDYFNDIFVSEKGRRSYMPPKVFDSEGVNTKEDELGATLSNDGEKMYFSSNREGGKGGFDIYYVQRLPNGQWSEIKNLGSPINTEGDEKYPAFSHDESYLFFSSNGHIGMGGMDLYKSKALEGLNKWQNPKNLGYPINTPFDDENISFAGNERYAYMAKRLDDTFGDLDIYRLTFQDKKDEYSLISGQVLTTDSTLIDQSINIEAFQENSGTFVGTYIMNRKNGKYSAILAPGRYVLEVKDAEGYNDYSKVINILGKNDQAELRKFNIILESQ